MRAPAGYASVTIGYPQPLLTSQLDSDLTDRPLDADGGTVVFRVGTTRVTVALRRGTTFTARAPRGKRVTVLAARDRYGNLASGTFTLKH